MRSASNRAKLMVDRYAAGATLEEVGREFKVTRERVRQIIVQAGYNVADLRRKATRIRKLRILDTNRPRIEALLAQGETPTDVARALRLPLDLVSLVDTSDPEYSRQRKTLRKKSMFPKYTSEEILECLRSANQSLGGVLTTAEYLLVARQRAFDDGRPWPTQQTAILRFGSWRSALKEAGLPFNPSTPIAERRIFEAAHCIDALIEVERALGHLPSVKEYEQYAKRMQGALPSAAIVRHRLGSWPDALRRATAFSRKVTLGP